MAVVEVVFVLDLCPLLRTINQCYRQLDMKVNAQQIMRQQMISDILV
jgi:hypothetical protein